MRAALDARLTRVWLALCALTCVATGAAAADSGADLSPSRPITFAALGLALVKVRLVVQNFMEVRSAPTWLTRASDGWLVVLGLAVIAIYLY